jgi:hypothetical protein
MKSNPFTEVAHRLPPSPVDQGHGNGRHGRREDENLPRAQPSGEARKLLKHVSPSTYALTSRIHQGRRGSRATLGTVGLRHGRVGSASAPAPHRRASPRHCAAQGSRGNRQGGKTAARVVGRAGAKKVGSGSGARR